MKNSILLYLTILLFSICGSMNFINTSTVEAKSMSSFTGITLRKLHGQINEEINDNNGDGRKVITISNVDTKGNGNGNGDGNGNNGYGKGNNGNGNGNNNCKRNGKGNGNGNGNDNHDGNGNGNGYGNGNCNNNGNGNGNDAGCIPIPCSYDNFVCGLLTTDSCFCHAKTGLCTGTKKTSTPSVKIPFLP